MAAPNANVENAICEERSSSTVDDQIYLDYLAAIQCEQQEILNVFGDSEVINRIQMEPLLTDTEIMSLFDSGYDVAMIIKAYPEFKIEKIKQLKRSWSDKNHNHKKKKKKQHHYTHMEEKANTETQQTNTLTDIKNKQKHTNLHEMGNNVQCELCLKCFKSEQGLNAHFQANVNNVMHGAI